ncbi:MAG: NAD(P)H-hydrate dehydratase [Phycisphaerales bacterium]|nr:NAD(P)H-hydrate dehydratase [Phycisphaerales bacterium]
MVPFITASDIKKVEQETIIEQHISSLNLMERAAKVCFENIQSDYPLIQSVLIVASVGNNGGDGLAIATMLSNINISVDLYIMGEPMLKASDEFKANFNSVRNNNQIHFVFDIKENKKYDVVIDALFGIGFKKRRNIILDDIIDQINNFKCPIISIDLPSGMVADDFEQNQKCIKATITYTFQVNKLCFAYSPNYRYLGKLKVLDIQLSPTAIKKYSSYFYSYCQNGIKDIYKPREFHSHKGLFGHSLIIGGQTGMSGAVNFASIGALHSGVGLLTTWLPKNIQTIFHTHVLEGMSKTPTQSTNQDFLSEFPDQEFIKKHKITGIAIGMGMGTNVETEEALNAWLQKKYSCPIIIDADAITIFSKNIKLLEIGNKFIFTPHPKEWERLGNKGLPFTNFQHCMDTAKRMAQKYNIFIHLKNSISLTFTPSGDIFAWLHPLPYLAKGGSGDVLSGVLAGLMSQGYESLHAIFLSQYLIYQSVQITAASKKESVESFLPHQITNNFGQAFISLLRKSSYE